MPYYRFVIHLLFYITMALSTDLILFEDIFYFPHFMKIFLVFFFCRYSFFSYRLVSFLLPNLLFTVFRRFFPKTCFYRLSAFFFVGLKFFLLRYIYLFLFIVEILFSKYYSFFFIIKILLEYFLWCFCISFSTDGISSLTSFFFYLLKFLFLQNYLPWKVTVSVGRIVPLNLSRAKIAFLNVKIFLSPNCFTEYILWGYMYYHEAMNYFSSTIIKRDIIHEIITIRISIVTEKTLIIFGK